MSDDATKWDKVQVKVGNAHPAGLAGKAALERTYDPNDCAEARWGARPGVEEYAPCNRHAPPAQRAQMERNRQWFHQMRRPSR